MNVDRDNLNDVMEFDRVICVHADGTVTHVEEYAPELCDGELSSGSAWSLMTGYTGQYGYRGPIMHESEYIGGRMADDILSTPGLYVALVSRVSTPADGCTFCESDTPCDNHSIDGWAVAYIHSGTAPVTYRDGDREVTVTVEDLDLDRPMTDAERAEHDRYHVHKRPGCEACDDIDRDDSPGDYYDY